MTGRQRRVVRPRPQRWTTGLLGCSVLVSAGAVLPAAAAPPAARASLHAAPLTLAAGQQSRPARPPAAAQPPATGAASAAATATTGAASAAAAATTGAASAAAAAQSPGPTPTLALRGARCLVIGHRAQAVLVRRLAADCEPAVPRVAAAWGEAPVGRVVVLVPGTLEELRRAAPRAGDLSQVPALTLQLPPAPAAPSRLPASTLEPHAAPADLRPVPASTLEPHAAPADPSRLPAVVQSATAAAGRGPVVLVHAAVFDRLSAVGGRVVLAHELTHLASWTASGGQLPAWLVEGLADQIGYLGQHVPLDLAASELRADVHAGRLPLGLPTDSAFDGPAGGRPQAYEGSWLAVRLLVDRYGQAAVGRLYRQVGSDRAPGALQRALVGLGTDLPRLTADWRSDLLTKLG